jgi:hypothetical protein
VARKVAVLSRALLSEQVGRVDRAVAKAIAGHAPSTVLEIARAKVIEADPDTHSAERERSRHERYVRLSRTTVTPVLDLRMRRRVDAYEHPEVVKDHVWVQTGGDCFPFTPRSATRDGVDFDHAIPYDDTGPPGQTGPHNSGPPRRRHHRTKTHGGLTARVVGPGRHLWRTPHGQAFLVDHTGTTRLTAHQSAAMAEAIEDGVELYFTGRMARGPG